MKNYGEFIEELKFAFVNEALIEGKPAYWAALGGDVALADEFESVAQNASRIMKCDVGIASRSFVAAGARLIQQYNKKRYRAKYIQGAAEYLETNYTKHFPNIQEIVKLRWMASLMIAIKNSDYEMLRKKYASHFEIDPNNPTAPYKSDTNTPHKLRDKIVLVLNNQSDVRSAFDV